MRRVEKTDNLVLTALMTCLVCLATYALKIPNPLTQGYVHIGDTFIFMSVLVLGKKNGAIASSIGAAMADIIGGYAIFAVGTFIAKGLMAYVMGFLIERGYARAAQNNEDGAAVLDGSAQHHTRFLSFTAFEHLAMILGGLTEVAIYVVVNALVYGNLTVGFLSIPGNIGQFAVSMVIAVLLTYALLKTPVKRYFAYAAK